MSKAPLLALIGGAFVLFLLIVLLRWFNLGQLPFQLLQAPVSSPNTITVQMGSLTGKTISPALLGVNQNYFNDFNNPNKLLDGFKQDGFNFSRFPAGCRADNYSWRENKDYAKFLTTGAEQRGPSLADTVSKIKSSGLEPVYLLNLFSFPFFSDVHNICSQYIFKSYSCEPCGGNCANCPFYQEEGIDEIIDLIEYLNYPPGVNLNVSSGNSYIGGNARLADGFAEPFNIKYFEIGNEMWGQYQWTRCKEDWANFGFASSNECYTHFMTGGDVNNDNTGMANITGLIAKTLKQYVPDAYVISSGIAHDDQYAPEIWTQQMLANQNVLAYTDGFQEHVYCGQWFGGGNGRTLEFTNEYFESYRLTPRYGNNGTYKQIGKDFWLTEYNLRCWGQEIPPKNQATGTLENGLFVVDMLRFLAQHQVKGAVFHDSHSRCRQDKRTCASVCVFTSESGEEKRADRIAGLAHKLFAKLKKNIVNVQNGFNKLQVMATAGNGKNKVTLLVINKSASSDIKANINFNNWQASAEANYSILSGDSFEDIDNYYLDLDQTTSFDGSFVFPAHSAVVLELTRAEPTPEPVPTATSTPQPTPTPGSPSLTPTPIPTNTPVPTTIPTIPTVTPTPIPNTHRVCANDCLVYGTATACDSDPECSWYFCSDRCLPTNTIKTDACIDTDKTCVSVQGNGQDQCQDDTDCIAVTPTSQPTPTPTPQGEPTPTSKPTSTPKPTTIPEPTNTPTPIPPSGCDNGLTVQDGDINGDCVVNTADWSVMRFNWTSAGEL